jgi:hypothetical protein
MNRAHDLFVGVIAMVFGCLLVLGAIANSGPLMSLTKPRLLAQTIGPAAARWTIAVIGLACIAMGVLIAGGWRIRW